MTRPVIEKISQSRIIYVQLKIKSLNFKNYTQNKQKKRNKTLKLTHKHNKIQIRTFGPRRFDGVVLGFFKF